MRLRGKVALLTGAAAAIKGELMGFGGAAAHLFVREGAKVVLTDIRDDLGERAAASLRAEGHDARYLRLDVTSEQNWAQVVDAVMAAHGRLDILFNNAGVSFPAKVEDTTVEIWDRELNVHAKGIFLGTRTAIPAMRKGGGGSIINTSSVMGIVGHSHLAGLFGRQGRHRDLHQVGGAAICGGKYPHQFGAPGLCGHAADVAALQRSACAPGAARSHADGSARHRPGYRQWRAVPGVRRIILGHRLGTGDRWRHDGAVSADRSTARRRAGGGRPSSDPSSEFSSPPSGAERVRVRWGTPNTQHVLSKRRMPQ